ncbi:sugar transferase [Zhouia spongiae]|uniref:Sugar transferase n=1 Tax=Zhouia spongiae TaxID=2202721 RepID=A0ABY3YKN7_9FLAO|nr:sugar transferase [Zhouia spongiae]UNY98400.1 sugar transferase [Zhouia spongiae]
MYANYLKRTIDFILSCIALVLLCPLFLILYVLLYFSNNGKPFFYQKRPGKHEKIFSIIKFKSMTDAVDEKGKLLPNDLRITKLGAFIRKTSLDEIPQLINVIKGDMSLVGPRPLRTHYLPYYTTEEGLRHSVRPGITGLAQVSGRNLLTWDDRLKKDVEYVKNISFILDLKIMVKTITKVFSSGDVDFVENMPDLDELRKQQKTTILT